jgi:hypothetical protein
MSAKPREKLQFMVEQGNIRRERCIEIARAAEVAIEEHSKSREMPQLAASMARCCGSDEDEAAFYCCAVDMVLAEKWGTAETDRAVFIGLLKTTYQGIWNALRDEQDDEPFFTSNPLGLPYNPLPKSEPNRPKRDKLWVEIAVEGWNESISKNIEAMREATNGLDFEQFMDAVEEYEHNRSMQLDELVREIVELKLEAQKSSPENKEEPLPQVETFKKRVPLSAPSKVHVRVLEPIQQSIPETSKSGWKWKPSFVFAGTAILLAVVIGLVWSSDETTVSGKSVDYWLGRLEDRDPREWTKAFDALRFCKEEDLEAARPRLRQMAVGSNIWARRAALLLFDKFGEVDAKFADAYLVTGSDETFLWGGSAIKALAQVDNSAASAAMMRKLERLPDAAPLRSDIKKVANEIIALRNSQ